MYIGNYIMTFGDKLSPIVKGQEFSFLGPSKYLPEVNKTMARVRSGVCCVNMECQLKKGCSVWWTRALDVTSTGVRSYYGSKIDTKLTSQKHFTARHIN